MNVGEWMMRNAKASSVTAIKVHTPQRQDEIWLPLFFVVVHGSWAYDLRQDWLQKDSASTPRHTLQVMVVLTSKVHSELEEEGSRRVVDQN